MKSLLLLSLLATAITGWQPDFAKAKEIAKEKHELILLNFSGSDWCGPCILMRKVIFDDPAFLAMADSSLVLVNADFPRNKKNQLAKDIKAQNETLADKYNPEGKFPYTILIDGTGKVVRSYDGMPDMSAAQFAHQVRSVCDGYK